MLEISGVQKQIIIAGCMYIGQLLAGFSGSYTGPIIPMLRDPEQSPLSITLTETQISLVGSLLYIGTIGGPYVMGWLSNIKGRRICLVIGGMINILAYVLLTTTKNLAMLYSGRILNGCGVGIISVMNIVYIGEMASTNIRGILLTVLGIFTTLGGILAFAFGSFLTYSAMSSVGIGLAVAFTFTAFLLPETPLFYSIRGEEKNAEKILRTLGRLEDISKLDDAKKEVIELNSTKDWIELFKVKSNRKALFIVVTINILQHASGVMAVVFFSGSIFDLAGSSIDFNIAMIIVGCFQLSGSSITPFLVERNGRKTLLIVSSAFCSLSMFTFGLYFYLDRIGYSGINNIKWLPLVILIVFYVSYNLGLGIIPNAIIGEMFTTNVRSKGSAVAMTSSWLAGFLITTAFGYVVESFGGHVMFWFFAFTCACAMFFTKFFIPETKGKSLLEIQELLGK